MLDNKHYLCSLCHPPLTLANKVAHLNKVHGITRIGQGKWRNDNVLNKWKIDFDQNKEMVLDIVIEETKNRDTNAESEKLLEISNESTPLKKILQQFNTRKKIRNEVTSTSRINGLKSITIKQYDEVYKKLVLSQKI